jgi:hypothetical protein
MPHKVTIIAKNLLALIEKVIGITTTVTSILIGLL